MNTRLPTPKKITFLYDRHCGLCSRFRDWLLAQPRHLETEFLAYDHPRAASVARGIPREELSEEIHAVADTGEVWVGGDAWILALWTTVAHRSLAASLAGPALRPMAKRLALAIAARRHRLSRWLRLRPEKHLAELARSLPPPLPCTSGTCKL